MGNFSLDVLIKGVLIKKKRCKAGEDEGRSPARKARVQANPDATPISCTICVFVCVCVLNLYIFHPVLFIITFFFLIDCLKLNLLAERSRPNACILNMFYRVFQANPDQ